MKTCSLTFCILLLFFFTSCDKIDVLQPDPVDQEMNLKGNIVLITGNCMPVFDSEQSSCSQTPHSTTISITKPSDVYDQSLVIKTVTSDLNGEYKVHLPEGSYSLFLKDGENYICDSWSCPSACYCSYFTIADGTVTTVDARVDHAVW